MDYNKTFNISMPKPLLDAIDKQAQMEFRNRSDLIREAARNYISQKGGMSQQNKLTEFEEHRIKESFKFSDFSAQPSIALSCSYRPQPNRVKDIFSADSKAMSLLEHPSKIREMGWDMDTLDRARPIAGEYLEVTNGKRKLIRLYRDGQHVFSSGMHFFGHSVNRNNNDYPRTFNLMAVAELITNFVDFSLEIAKTLERGSDMLLFTIAVSNPRPSSKIDNGSLLLAAYNGLGTEKAGELNLEWVERNIVVHTEDSISSDQIAYLIYSEFCYFFGSRSDELWYVNKDKSMKRAVFINAGR